MQESSLKTGNVTWSLNGHEHILIHSRHDSLGCQVRNTNSAELNLGLVVYTCNPSTSEWKQEGPGGQGQIY